MTDKRGRPNTLPTLRDCPPCATCCRLLIPATSDPTQWTHVVARRDSDHEPTPTAAWLAQHQAANVEHRGGV